MLCPLGQQCNPKIFFNSDTSTMSIIGILRGLYYSTIEGLSMCHMRWQAKHVHMVFKCKQKPHIIMVAVANYDKKHLIIFSRVDMVNNSFIHLRILLLIIHQFSWESNKLPSGALFFSLFPIVFLGKQRDG